MHLILTHEQADFDALASLYGAALLADSAIPVLPRRMNRNGRAFITLYGTDFPFIDPRDLPQGAIESVTLVDTQSLVTLKGMGAQTKVIVFDHHPRRKGVANPVEKGLPQAWDIHTFETGATTTYFVELLEAREEALSEIQATLLLLGIYEDTGSLTYARTTARDARAAAWLLEQGADLRIAVRFLNPPLSLDQRAVYDRLVSAAETLDIHGQRIILACGEVLGLTEEVSTLAHKLRDLFDPDALFVLVQTAEGVRLVARSTSDQIDVSAIAAHFGGGGHDRAAAALIHHPTPAGRGVGGEDDSARADENDLTHHSSLLTETRAQLLALLPAHVRPAIMVSQLMSKRPRLLDAAAPVQEAAKLMQKYGYEGFPVVRDGQIIGLLTRRAVDRALSHRLNLAAASLMEAGEVYVHPSDSLQRLQTLMTDSGWGQIPVVDPQSGKIAGIVTRTDLLKTLARRPQHAAPPHNLAAKLEKSLPAGHLALIRAVAEEAANEHLPVYIVGGFVRDLLLNHPGLDFDIVVEGDAIALARALTAKYGGKITSHSRFGTAKWNLASSTFNLQPSTLDLISSRQEFYDHPSALPSVERGSIKLDLHRRDFTINTLALRLDGRHFGELHDYYGGRPDLERRLVRVLHSLSFVDDPTRMLRAVRYEQRYSFQIEPRTLQLIHEARQLLDRLSEERLRHELDLIFDEPKAAVMLARLDELGLLNAIVEGLPWSLELRERLESGLQAIPAPGWGLELPLAGVPLRWILGYTLWLIDLPPAQIELLHQRLRFPLMTLKTLRAAAVLWAELPALGGQPPSKWAERLDEIPLSAIYAVYLLSGEVALEQYAAHWRHIHPHTTGDTLKALGLPPGPAYQQILGSLRAAWLDGTVTTAAQEGALLQELLKT